MHFAYLLIAFMAATGGAAFMGADMQRSVQQAGDRGEIAARAQERAMTARAIRRERKMNPGRFPATPEANASASMIASRNEDAIRFGGYQHTDPGDYAVDHRGNVVALPRQTRVEQFKERHPSWVEVTPSEAAASARRMTEGTPDAGSHAPHQ